MNNMLSNLNGVRDTMTRGLGRVTLMLKKHSPSILVAVGIGGVIYGGYRACKATLKLDEVMDELAKDGEMIKRAKEEFLDTGKTETYSETDYSRDLVVHYAKTGAALIKLYGPSVAISTASIGCIVGSHYILNKRNVALMGAYTAIEQSFKDYRKRLIDDLGEDKDREYKYGLTKTTVAEKIVADDGTETEVQKEIMVPSKDAPAYSVYARIFDDGNPNWVKSSDLNLFFLKRQMDTANDMLRARGHLFLNEVYDLLDIPRSSFGALVGWVYGGDGDSYVDFGIFNGNNEGARNFVNGFEQSVWLDFNVDGVIYNLI